ncbi:hypothetical protein UlMin_008429 [Ulmus minor]
MQRLLSLKKLGSNLSSKVSLLHSQPHNPYKPFASLTKPVQTHSQNHFFTSSVTHRLPHHAHPWRSQHTLSAKIPGFLSNPLLAKRFLDSSNSLLRFTKRNLADCRVGFRKIQFPEIPNSRSYQRNWRSWLRGLTPSDTVLGLIIANVIVFLLWRVANPRFMYQNFTVTVENVKSGRLHTLITSAFSHIDMEHIIHNMIGLYFFGMHVAQSFGPEFLLKLYLAGALTGSIFLLVHSAFLASSSKGQSLWTDPLRTPALGASGAVNAIVLLDIFLFPKSTLYFNFFIPIPAILLGIYIVGKDFMEMLEGKTPGSAHLGGAAVAAITWARLRKGRF